MVWEMFSRGNVRSVKCLSGEMSGQGSLHRRSVCRGSVLGEVSVGELSAYPRTGIIFLFLRSQTHQCFNMCELAVNFEIWSVTLTLEIEF